MPKKKKILLFLVLLVKCRPPADFLSPFGFPSRGTVKATELWKPLDLCTVKQAFLMSWECLPKCHHFWCLCVPIVNWDTQTWNVIIFGTHRQEKWWHLRHTDTKSDDILYMDRRTCVKIKFVLVVKIFLNTNLNFCFDSGVYFYPQKLYAKFR